MGGHEHERKHQRTQLRADVKLYHAEIGEVDLHTKDISGGGAFLCSEGKVLPGVGEVVSVQVQGMSGGDAPVVKMRVIRIDEDGIGLEFIAGE